jgi:hypothetical protein
MWVWQIMSTWSFCSAWTKTRQASLYHVDRYHISSAVKMEVASSPEISLHVYQTTRRHIPEDIILTVSLFSFLHDVANFSFGQICLLGSQATFRRNLSPPSVGSKSKPIAFNWILHNHHCQNLTSYSFSCVVSLHLFACVSICSSETV